MTIASPWLHACQYIALTCMYNMVGIQSDFYNQHNTQHTESYGCVRMHVYMHLAFKELINLPA